MLAIVIPYYKLTFFDATLHSLANQTDKRFKVYIGDDASLENPSDLLESFKGKFDFVYHRFKTNIGGTSLVKQWERCIALSGEEEWMMILGDDDLLGENVVEVFYANLFEIERAGVNVMRFATQVVNGKGEFISEIYSHPKVEKSTDFIIKKMKHQTRSSLSEYVFKKEVVLTISFKNFNLGWYTDDLAVLEFSFFKNVYSLNNALVYVRFSILSISGDASSSRKKNDAKFNFYYYLISQKRRNFSETQKKDLFLKLSKCYIGEKKQFNYFFKISYLCLRFFWIISYLGFVKSAIYYTFRRNGRR